MCICIYRMICIYIYDILVNYDKVKYGTCTSYIYNT